MSYQGKSRRRQERTEISLPLEVEYRESTDQKWNAHAQLLDVTPFGARLVVPLPTEPGRLLHLALPLPGQLRCYDHDEKLYRIWAVVRHARVISPSEDYVPQFEIGVAFTGKESPESFAADPATLYDLAPTASETGLWEVSARPQTEGGAFAGVERRREPRHEIATAVVIEIYDAQGRVQKREQARTENISQRGMAVLTSLNIVRGRYIRVRSAEYRVAVIAAVRRLRPGADKLNRLHLEFVDQQWPLLEESA